ncbi:MAG: A/G-specific adenine glycosylase [Bacteroidota bacterium]
MNDFSESIIEWYEKNKRDLPWRNTNNPYYIWISEVILQQTRVDQGLPYYIKFIESFPQIELLAQAPQDEVLRLWQGLGYYSRGRNLHFTAKQIVDDFGGIFPTEYENLIRLKGIGSYTASAISSFCNNEHRAVVDGNVYRVLSRYFGIDTDISSNQAKKQFQELAESLLNKKKSGQHNQAIMEFGALQCVPKNPSCDKCPLKNSCAALQNKMVDRLPVKTKKIKSKKRYFNYLMIIDEDERVLVNKRTSGDIWEGLYEFPLVETDDEMNYHTIASNPAFKKITRERKYNIAAVSNVFKHQLTHQTIYCKFFTLKIKDCANETLFSIVSWNEFDKYPKPILIQRFYQINQLKMK